MMWKVPEKDSMRKNDWEHTNEFIIQDGKQLTQSELTITDIEQGSLYVYFIFP